MLLLDLYVFQVIKALSSGSTEKTKLTIYSIYWLISIAAVALMVLMPYLNYESWPKTVRAYVFATIVGLFFAKLVAAIFFLLDDARRALMWIMGKVFPGFGVRFVDESGIISRSAFLSWLGVGIGGTLFGTLVFGFSNKYNYHVKRIRLKYDNLPHSFKGLKVIQVSDIHSGSFTDKEAVQRGVNLVLKENPDLILFTGDLVNDKATEMNNFTDTFSRLKAPMGVYSTLGNHDYGDYVQWPIDGVSKEQNLLDLQKVHAAIGWKLLMNEHIALERNGESIAIIGIENWSSKARFPKHGRMDLAHAGTEKYPFKILLSHDPSHWDAQVRPSYTDVDLMLSGHTHGMQFGVELPGFKWSPVQYMYPQWSGLYESGKQKLYVNRGFGFIGYPGRVGVLPEITLIELV